MYFGKIGLFDLLKICLDMFEIIDFGNTFVLKNMFFLKNIFDVIAMP